MKALLVAPFLVAVLCIPLDAQTAVPASAGAAVAPHFEVFAPLLGRTWRGVFEESTPQKPVVDVARWELALGGTAIRVMHSINDGAYGGETIIVWDETRQSLVFHYFTTAGFHTSGTMRAEAGSITTHESVTGSQNVTDVVATYTVMPDGTVKSIASYLRNGEHVGGRAVTYVEAPDAVVVLP